MELTPLRYFRAIAHTRHLTRAAESLGVTQPALSAMLRKLEAHVGAPLLHRTGKGVELTDAGRVFLAHAEDALRAADAAVQSVRQLAGLEKGSIRIGGGATATTYILPPVVRAVRAAHPGLRFYVREAGSSAVALAVLSGELDLGIVTMPIDVPGARDLVETPLVEDELRLIRPPGAGRGRPATAAKSGFRWKDLAGEPFVSFEAGTAVRAIIDNAARAAGVALDVVMELRSIESIKSMVGAGIGVGLVSRFALGADTPFGDGLPCGDGRLRRTLAIVRRADRLQSDAAKAFLRHLTAAHQQPRQPKR